MKAYYKIIYIKLLFVFLFVGCTDNFESLNTDPKTVPNVAPEELLYTVATKVSTSGHYWNSHYAFKFRWLQYGGGIWGGGDQQFKYYNNNCNDIAYNNYNEIGSLVTNMEYLISLMDEKDAKKYIGLEQVGRIILISKAIQVSEMAGSLVYSQGWLARKGMIDDDSMTPEFETQEQLVEVWDNHLKSCIEKLKSIANAEQTSLRGYDRVYNGDYSKWIKAANGIRLRLASRIWNRVPEKSLTIAKEVLAPENANYVFNNNEDNFILWFDKLYTNVHSGDWHSVKDMEIASYCMMNYMNKYEDPRRRIYFAINNLTQENIIEFNAQQEKEEDKIPLEYGRWIGGPVSFDSQTGNRERRLLYLNKNGERIDMRPANLPQVRLWKGNDNNGGGANWAPVMTYSDFCFLAAEYVLRENIPSSKTPQQWYEDGVKASLEQWSELGSYCDIYDYEAITSDEITAFMNKPDIKWDNNPVKALEQIHAQAYLDHFKNQDEGYARWKRVNYPNTESSILTFEEIFLREVPGVVPRKAKFTEPNPGDHNYANLKKRLDEMQKDPQFGDINNEFGRVWWDYEIK